MVTTKHGKATIDVVPALAETGGGVQIALFDGAFADSTERLSGTWCGDLLQIVDALPKGHKLINCCFAECATKIRYCYRMFGVNEYGYLHKNNVGELFEATKLNLRGNRGPLSLIKVERDEEYIRYRSASEDEVIRDGGREAICARKPKNADAQTKMEERQ